jgi:hypothetical protein
LLFPVVSSATGTCPAQPSTSALLEVWPARQRLSLVSSGQLGNRHLPSPAPRTLHSSDLTHTGYVAVFH